ncbi:MAG: hypothetical protein IK130_01370, partial [Oscillospiraceae bacterium]|nr:hypothetical protein [Oscillospiraceae bacterium]
MKVCWNCLFILNDQDTICPKCKVSQTDDGFIPTQQQSQQPLPVQVPLMEQQNKQKKPFWKRDIDKSFSRLLLVAIIGVCIITYMKHYNRVMDAGKDKNYSVSTTAPNKSDYSYDLSSKTTKAININDCFRTMQEERISSYYGTSIIEKVLGKENIVAVKTLILKDKDGNVIDKSEDVITLVAGNYNYFSFYIHSEITDDMVLESTIREGTSFRII